jgi:zinc transport system substrate-binding protein
MPLFPLLIALFLYSAAGRAAAEDAIEVFVSIAPQQYLVQRIGGARVNVTVMLKPGHSPETYDPVPRQMALLAKARIYFLIGVPFEIKWREKFRLQNAGMRMVATGQQGRVINNDPHIWTSPVNASLIAGEIRNALVDADPGGTPLYESNFQSLDADLKKLDADIKDMLKERRTDYFIVSHDAWAYYAERYGLQQLTLESRGREKGPRGIAELSDLARRENIRTLFVQRQHPGGSAHTLAAELGARVAVIDPLAADYIDNLRRVTASIAESVH